ncbi:hypothetical protein C2S51_022219 [Perilla frutescens var. frutescens]|nr:hypothetical protein C2S51_022219 [Perilla frutescens var. frutescens]
MLGHRRSGSETTTASSKSGGGQSGGDGAERRSGGGDPPCSVRLFQPEERPPANQRQRCPQKLGGFKRCPRPKASDDTVAGVEVVGISAGVKSEV